MVWGTQIGFKMEAQEQIIETVRVLETVKINWAAVIKISGTYFLTDRTIANAFPLSSSQPICGCFIYGLLLIPEL